MNGNPVGGLFLMAFLGLTVWAVIEGQSKWKLFNLLICLGGASIGLGMGALAGWWSDNDVLGGHLAASFLPIFGCAAAYICVRRNTIRKKKPAAVDHPQGPESVRASHDPANN